VRCELPFTLFTFPFAVEYHFEYLLNKSSHYRLSTKKLTGEAKTKAGNDLATQFLLIYHSRKSNCQCALGNFFFMMEILIRVSLDEKKMNWPKKTLCALP
jgi:hypothetical protein